MKNEEMKICERFKLIRKKLGMKQNEFASEIKLTQGHVSDIENKRKAVSDRTIEIICLKFNIREEWIRYGIEPIENQIDLEYEKIATLIGEKDFKAKKAIVDYWKLTTSDKELFWKFVDTFIKKKEV